MVLLQALTMCLPPHQGGGSLPPDAAVAQFLLCQAVCLGLQVHGRQQTRALGRSPGWACDNASHAVGRPSDLVHAGHIAQVELLHYADL